MATFISSDYFFHKDKRNNDDDNNNKKTIKIPELKVNGLSSPNFPNFQKSPKSPNFNSSVFKDLPVKLVNYNDLPNLLLNTKILIIDVRSFNHYINSRIKNSINICLPSTLLKRQSYCLPQVLNSAQFDNSIKELLLSQDNQQIIDILFYDDNSYENHISSQLYQTILKFLNYKTDNNNYNIVYLNHGFDIQKIDQHLIDHQLSPISPINTASLKNSNINNLNNININDHTNNNNNNVNYTINGSSENNLPTLLSGFQLPSSASSSSKFLSSMKTIPKLNIETIKTSDIENYKYNFKFLENPNFRNDKLKYLPIWLKNIFLKNNDNKLNSTEEILKVLNVKFNKIEYNEQIRLKLAINGQLTYNCNCTPSTPCPSCDGITYKIPKGIEYGMKNRYKNIFPFEHSRVKLIHDNQFEQQQLHQQNQEQQDHQLQVQHHHHHHHEHFHQQYSHELDDYFNGNFIEYNKVSNFKYIATQNPLQSTYHDFWNLVWCNTNLIVCLNNQNDFNLKYFDNQILDNIEIKLEEMFNYDNFNLRILNITKLNESKLVYHLEYKDWPDFGVPNIDSILQFIEFKSNLILNKNLNNSSLVHCSAGCGRTGAYITIDMILDLFKSNKIKNKNNLSDDKLNPFDKTDLIYKSVQFQRCQRVSMVQNFDQYLVCYDTIFNYLMNND